MKFQLQFHRCHRRVPLTLGPPTSRLSISSPLTRSPKIIGCNCRLRDERDVPEMRNILLPSAPFQSRPRRSQRVTSCFPYPRGVHCPSITLPQLRIFRRRDAVRSEIFDSQMAVVPSSPPLPLSSPFFSVAPIEAVPFASVADVASFSFSSLNRITELFFQAL